MEETRLTSPERCAAVCAEPEPVLRNLQITLSYYDFAAAFAGLVSGRDATWPAFACWASKSAGRFIRLQTAVHRWRGRLAAAPFEEVSHQIAEGNRKVYEELAPLFAAFLEAFRDTRAYDEGRVAAFTQALRAGRTEEGEGQERLAVAFEALHRAQFEADPSRRAEWVFLANCLIGLHEQIRLQQHIQGGLVGAVSRLRGYARTLSYRLRAPAPLRRVGVAALQGMEARWKRMATEWMMHLPLSDEHLDLGDDVPPLSEEGAYPEALRVLLLPASRSLVSEWDPTPGSLAESGTEDWSDLPDRMHFILELFRTRQQSPRVLAAPFSREQEEAIRTGRVPPGPL